MSQYIPNLSLHQLTSMGTFAATTYALCSPMIMQSKNDTYVIVLITAINTLSLFILHSALQKEIERQIDEKRSKLPQTPPSLEKPKKPTREPNQEENTPKSQKKEENPATKLLITQHQHYISRQNITQSMLKQSDFIANLKVQSDNLTKKIKELGLDKEGFEKKKIDKKDKINKIKSLISPCIVKEKRLQELETIIKECEEKKKKQEEAIRKAASEKTQCQDKTVNVKVEIEKAKMAELKGSEDLKSLEIQIEQALTEENNTNETRISKTKQKIAKAKEYEDEKIELSNTIVNKENIDKTISQVNKQSENISEIGKKITKLANLISDAKTTQKSLTDLEKEIEENKIKIENLTEGKLKEITKKVLNKAQESSNHNTFLNKCKDLGIALDKEYTAAIDSSKSLLKTVENDRKNRIEQKQKEIKKAEESEFIKSVSNIDDALKQVNADIVQKNLDLEDEKKSAEKTLARCAELQIRTDNLDACANAASTLLAQINKNQKNSAKKIDLEKTDDVEKICAIHLKRLMQTPPTQPTQKQGIIHFNQPQPPPIPNLTEIKSSEDLLKEFYLKVLNKDSKPSKWDVLFEGLYDDKKKAGLCLALKRFFTICKESKDYTKTPEYQKLVEDKSTNEKKQALLNNIINAKKDLLDIQNESAEAKKKSQAIVEIFKKESSFPIPLEREKDLPKDIAELTPKFINIIKTFSQGKTSKGWFSNNDWEKIYNELNSTDKESICLAIEEFFNTLTSIKTEALTKDGELQELKGEESEIQSKIRNLENKNIDFLNQKQELENKLKTTQEEVNQNKESLTNLQDLLSQSKCEFYTEFPNSKEKIISVEEKLRTLIQQIDPKNPTQESEIITSFQKSELTYATNDLNELLRQLQSNLEKNETKERHHNEKILEMEKALNILKNDLSGLKSEIELKDKVESLKKKKVACDVELKKIKENLVTLNNKLDALKNSIDENENAIQTAKVEMGIQSQQLQELKASGNRDEEIRQVKDKLAELQKILQEHLEKNLEGLSKEDFDGKGLVIENPVSKLTNNKLEIDKIASEVRFITGEIEKKFENFKTIDLTNDNETENRLKIYALANELIAKITSIFNDQEKQKSILDGELSTVIEQLNQEKESYKIDHQGKEEDLKTIESQLPDIKGNYLQTIEVINESSLKSVLHELKYKKHALIKKQISLYKDEDKHTTDFSKNNFNILKESNLKLRQKNLIIEKINYINDLIALQNNTEIFYESNQYLSPKNKDLAIQKLESAKKKQERLKYKSRILSEKLYQYELLNQLYLIEPDNTLLEKLETSLKKEQEYCIQLIMLKDITDEAKKNKEAIAYFKWAVESQIQHNQSMFHRKRHGELQPNESHLKDFRKILIETSNQINNNIKINVENTSNKKWKEFKQTWSGKMPKNEPLLYLAYAANEDLSSSGNSSFKLFNESLNNAFNESVFSKDTNTRTDARLDLIRQEIEVIKHLYTNPPPSPELTYSLPTLKSKISFEEKRRNSVLEKYQAILDIDKKQLEINNKREEIKLKEERYIKSKQEYKTELQDLQKGYKDQLTKFASDVKLIKKYENWFHVLPAALFAVYYFSLIERDINFLGGKLRLSYAASSLASATIVHYATTLYTKTSE